MRVPTQFLVLLLLMLLSTACTSVLVNNDSWGQSGADHRSSAQLQQDAEINAAVVTAFIHDTIVDSTQIQVDTRRAVVSLTGKVSSRVELNRAVSLARSAKGVRQVIPRLVVVQ